MKIKILFTVSFFLIILLACQPNGPVEERMQKVLDEGIASYQIHGVSATVIYPDGHTWSGVSGFSHDTILIKPDMLFAIGSVTKNIIAALTLKLAEQKSLSLDDPVSAWLPAYPYVDGAITIRQLLNHTSGLYMFWDNQNIWDELKKNRSRVWSPEDVLQYIKEPCFAPGEGWRYSNTNYLLLAMIIKKASGLTLSHALQKYFWQSLGIKDVYLSQEQDIPFEKQAHVYGDNFQFGEPQRDITSEPRASHETITYGSSGIFISSKNLARWSQALFSGRILSNESMNEMLTFVEFDPVANMSAYGLGTQVYDPLFSYGKTAIGHGGGNIGTTTYMVYFPEYHTTIAVMINAFPNKGIDVITKGLIRLAIKDIGIFDIIFSYYLRFKFMFFGAIIIAIIINMYRFRKKHKLKQL